MDQVVDFISRLAIIYRWLIIIYIFMSWLPNVRESFVGDFLGKIVEPYLRPFRKIIPPIGGVLDISPIVALFVLPFVVSGLVYVLDFLANLG